MSRQGQDGYRNMSNGSNPSMTNNSMAPSGQARTVSASATAASRAERFEDEKRRIIESCFTKQDPNGQLAESYITHIRIQEDSQYPSAPPPPDSQPENKKPRLIVISVRSTGRVRLHKARENTNGSFSIGKTWNMEELSAIESYASSKPPQSEKEAQQRLWAGSVGFTVTVTKPYFWQAGTAKEKEFFIASAVKIYKKYTHGQVPDLRGFDDQQKNAMLGGPTTATAQQQRPAVSESRSASGSNIPAPPQPPFASRPQSREHSRYRESPGPPPSVSDRDLRTPSASGSRAPSESQSPARFNEPIMARPKAYASTEQLRTTNSRDGAQSESRPGTSPGPGGYRSPPAMNHMAPLPSPQSFRSQGRTQSPASLSMQSSRDRPQSPLRNESEGDERRGLVSSMNGSTGAELFASSRQRLADHQYQQASPASSPGMKPPPPFEDSRQAYRSQERHMSPAPRAPYQSSRKDSDAMDPSEAATLGILTGFEPPPHNVASPPPSSSAYPQPASPPTPERSKRRPPLDTSIPSASPDLRPPPLNARSRDVSAGQSTQTNVSSVENQSFSPTKNRFGTSVTGSSTPPTGNFQTSETAATGSSAVSSKIGDSDGNLDPEIAREPEQEEDYRPGLGPMIKKRAVAERFKKAATAASAFKPRPGGAAEKIMKAKAEREANGGPVEPDGITGVVPRPVAKPEPSKDQAASTSQQSTPVVEVFPSTPTVQSAPQGAHSGMDGATPGVELRDESSNLQDPSQQYRRLEDDLATKQPQVKVRRRDPQHLRYLEELGVDSSLLTENCVTFEGMLYDFGWTTSQLSSKALSNMEADLRREQAKLEAGSWLSIPAHDNVNMKDDKERQVLNLLDKAIQECDEMDGLLTIYHVELSSLNDDVAFIEAQSQGLQVQSANQQLLFTELSNLLETMALDKRTMEPLRRADLSSSRGLEDAERALVKLYQAMITIDPTIHSTSAGRRKSRSVISESNELATMAAIKQKREVYERESTSFCQRLLQHLDQLFTKSLSDAKSRALEPASSGAMKLRKETWPEIRRPMWMYSPLIFFTKELNPHTWQAMLKTYQARAKPVYADVFGKNLASWKRAAKKSTGEESEILFTAQEKEDVASSGGALSSARKLTVKRSHTLARSLRHASGGDKFSPSETRHTGSLMPSEVFSGSVDEMAVLISQEQNFIVDFFHASSIEQGDFIDAVMASRPDERLGTNLQSPKPTEPDRELARRVTAAMDDIFGFFTSETTSLMDWCIVNDPIQGVGVMACLNRHSFFLQESNQEFLIQLVEQLLARLQNLFSKFVQEQVRAIEETKVKIKKRKGVIAFMKTFPHFSAAVENTFSSVAVADYDNDAACMSATRQTLDEAYSKINRAMFDSLKIIAKESPTAVAQPSAAGGVKAAADDPEDKEMLNYHILLIENMNHYIEEVDDGGKEGVLAEWKGKALMERAEAMEAYVSRVLRRPLGKLLDFLDSIDTVKESHPHNAAAITSRPTYSRKVARTTLSQYDGKEIRRGIDVLRKRIEKHFGDADDEAISRALVSFVCKDCERAYERTITRCEDMIRELYPPAEGEKPVELEFTKADVAAGFRK